MSIKKFDLLLYILLINVLSSISLHSGAVVLIKGTLLNSGTKSPIGTKIYFIDSKGKKTFCNSNSLDGSYQQVLTSGESYYVLLHEYMMIEGVQSFFIPEYKEYTEITRNFTGQKLEPGMELSRTKAFEPNNSRINESSKTMLLSLKELLLVNAKVHINVKISSQDSWFEPKKIKEEVKTKTKKGTAKKSYKYNTISTEEQLNDLLVERAASLKGYLNSIGIRDTRVEYVYDLKSKKPVKSKKVKGKKQKPIVDVEELPNMTITINKIMNL